MKTLISVIVASVVIGSFAQTASIPQKKEKLSLEERIERRAKAKKVIAQKLGGFIARQEHHKEKYATSIAKNASP